MELGCIKAAEDGDGLVVRLFETEGKETSGTLKLGGKSCTFKASPYEIVTLLFDGDAAPVPVNLLEEGC